MSAWLTLILPERIMLRLFCAQALGISTYPAVVCDTFCIAEAYLSHFGAAVATKKERRGRNSWKARQMDLTLRYQKQKTRVFTLLKNNDDEDQ